MTDLLGRFCRLCGHFEREREGPVDAPRTSASWAAMYRAYRERPPLLTRY